MTQTLSNEELMALSGQSLNNQDRLFRMRLNSEPEDGNKNRLPLGTYVLPHPEDKAAVIYAESVLFRPFVRSFMYAVWDTKEKRFDPRTILVSSLNEEMLDTQGGVKCGKVDKDKLEELSEAEKAKQKTIRCYVHLYGLASAKAKSAEGADVVVTDVPCYIRGAGISFMPLSDSVDAFTKQRKPMISYSIELTSARKKTGGNVYYAVVAQPLLGNAAVQLAPDDLAQLNTFRQTISDENKYVLNQNAKFRSSTTKMAKEVVAAALADDLNDDVSNI